MLSCAAVLRDRFGGVLRLFVRFHALLLIREARRNGPQKLAKLFCSHKCVFFLPVLLEVRYKSGDQT